MAKKSKKIENDTTAGSRSFNRFEMQVSQVLHMAIELYDNLNYLFILDHYDDITLFDLDTDPLVVSYYQMKTSDGSITIDSAISENWIAKLYTQLKRSENWLVKELGLITNVPLDIKYKIPDEHNQKRNREEHLTEDHTSFGKLNPAIQERIREDIATKLNIDSQEVDLSKFVHLRTKLSITSHKEITEHEMSDFLYAKYPKITVEMVKSIYATMIELLARRQAYETIPSDADLEEVRKHKGITREDFNRVIDQVMVISIPEYFEVEEMLRPFENVRTKVSLAYVTIAADINRRDNKSYYQLLKLVREAVKAKPYEAEKSVWDYCDGIADDIRKKEPLLCVPYDGLYIQVLITCILLNEMRRSNA